MAPAPHFHCAEDSSFIEDIWRKNRVAVILSLARGSTVFYTLRGSYASNFITSQGRSIGKSLQNGRSHFAGGVDALPSIVDSLKTSLRTAWLPPG